MRVAGEATSIARLSGGTSSSAVLPDLAYDYSALEPTISAKIMELHHSKHHQTYVTNLNIALEKLADAEAKGDVDAIIALQPALRFNGGGHINHSIFWENLAPGGASEPSGDLKAKIEAAFGDFQTFKTAFNAQTAAVQGSGWGWLAYDKPADAVKIVTMANQDPLEATTGLKPLLGIDVWEHAYYLDYLNARPKYLEAVWDVVNFDDVARRLDEARA